MLLPIRAAHPEDYLLADELASREIFAGNAKPSL
jgi:hypothetical protein